MYVDGFRGRQRITGPQIIVNTLHIKILNYLITS